MAECGARRKEPIIRHAHFQPHSTQFLQLLTYPLPSLSPVTTQSPAPLLSRRGQYPSTFDMSGFEVAGLVLGAFPILYDAAKDARGRYRDLKWWWRFETEFEDFISAIDREFIAFSQNQEILLSPLDISSWERDVLQNDPKTLLWHEPHIQTQLRKRLQNRYYTWYMEQLHEMNKAISELITMLPTGKVRSLKVSH